MSVCCPLQANGGVSYSLKTIVWTKVQVNLILLWKIAGGKPKIVLVHKKKPIFVHKKKKDTDLFCEFIKNTASLFFFLPYGGHS